MAKFCANCGAPMDDEDRVCGQCGTPAETEGAPLRSEFTAPTPVVAGFNNANNGRPVVKQESQNAKVGKIIVLSALALLGLLLMFGVIKIIGNNSGENGVVGKYCKAIQKDDVELLESVTSPLYEDVADYYGYDIEETLQRYIDNKIETMEDKAGTLSKITYEITKSKSYNDKKMEEFIENYEDRYNSDGSDIKEVREVEVKMKAKGSKKTATFTENMYLIKHKSGWKVLLDSYR